MALAIAPDDMTEWRARLQAHGVEIEHEQTWSQGSHSLYFRDPDDNSLELIEIPITRPFGRNIKE